MKLSICIPTYNFGKFIGKTLESIVPQLTENVEIVILDGASTDNTAEVVQSFQDRVPQIRYFRQPEKGGIDKDMHLSVENAQGDYCWLFSSDDLLRKGVISRVLQEIQEGHDIYVCGFTICSLDMSKVIEEHLFSSLTKPSIFDLSDPKARAAYFRSAIATPAFFSFMGSLIINRKRWLNTPVDPSFIGTCWAHAGRIFRMIPQGLRVKHIPDSFLFKRAFNDSFMDKGYIHRMAIAIDGYQDIANTIFGQKSEEAFHIRRTLRHEFYIRTFLEAKKQIRNKEEARTFYRLLKRNFCDLPVKRWLYYLIAFMMTDSALRFLVMLNQIKKRTVSSFQNRGQRKSS